MSWRFHSSDAPKNVGCLTAFFTASVLGLILAIPLFVFRSFEKFLEWIVKNPSDFFVVFLIIGFCFYLWIKLTPSTTKIDDEKNDKNGKENPSNSIETSISNSIRTPIEEMERLGWKKEPLKEAHYFVLPFTLSKMNDNKERCVIYWLKNKERPEVLIMDINGFRRSADVDEVLFEKMQNIRNSLH